MSNLPKNLLELMKERKKSFLAPIVILLLLVLAVAAVLSIPAELIYSLL